VEIRAVIGKSQNNTYRERMMQSNFQVTSQLNDERQTCPAGKYWVKPHTRKKSQRQVKSTLKMSKDIAAAITILLIIWKKLKKSPQNICIFL